MFPFRRLSRPAARVLALATTIALASCSRDHNPAPHPALGYVVGEPWFAQGVWHYPRERFALDETGLATLMPPDHGPVTADNAPYDPQAMMAAMADVQLPAVAILTNLQNGRAVRLRIDDQGPASPARLIAVTPGVARLLAVQDGTRVRVRFDQAANLALVRELGGGADKLAITAAPLGQVQAAALAPLPGSRAAPAPPPAPAPPHLAAVPTEMGTQTLRLPPTLLADTPDPGQLMLNAGSFSNASAADLRARMLLDVGAHVIRAARGRAITYRVMAGPFITVASADAALARAIANGATDARLVVELD